MAKKQRGRPKGGFVKVVKNKAYFKRYQVKFKRRRQGLTDYAARKKLIVQSKNKYNTPKYRVTVRITNRDIIGQIMYSKIEGDMIVSAAYAHELPRYGIKVGLTNYSAAYSVGLLLARRTLQKFKLDKEFVGVEKVDGEYFNAQENADENGKPERNTFRCALDVGLKRTSTGAKVFGFLKGCVDGGLNVPHEVKRFYAGGSEEDYDAGAHRDHILGKAVADYMNIIKDAEPDKYERHFSQFIKHGINAGNIQAMYEKAHANIRADPSPSPKKPEKKEHLPSTKHSKWTNFDRKNRVVQKKKATIERIRKIAEAAAE